MKEQVEEYREAMIEFAGRSRTKPFWEKYLEGEELTLDEIKSCIRKGTRELAFFPTYCGSSFKNKGVQLVLECGG